MQSEQPEELSTRLGISAARLHDVLAAVVAGLPAEQVFVFRIPPGAASGASAPARPRTIPAFMSADDALTWAQRNGGGPSIRLRCLAAGDLLRKMLATLGIGSITFAHALEADVRGRQMPPGVTVTRDWLLQELMNKPLMTLTAEAYDALQFGIDFTQRGAFRAALAEAVENIVADYTPPPGSLDEGARSIFATTVVEEWLRNNGFPRANQRRWIDVAYNPEWGGAEELCEIDCGTANSLLVQLLIERDGARQRIGQVRVTS